MVQRKTEITDEKLDKYFDITTRALEKARSAPTAKSGKDEIIDMVSRYVSDAGHFREKGDYVNAFAALSYAHGWLDCGARLGIFVVIDDKLFTVDGASQ